MERAIKALTGKAAWVGGGALVAMVVITFVDVIGTKLFRRPLAGSYEFVALAQLVAVSLAGADTLISGRHVRVEMLVDRLPARLRRLIIALVASLGIVLFGVAAWEGFLYGESLRAAREVTGTVKIPLYPFAHILGLGGSLLCLALGRELLDVLRGRRWTR